jgi:hypothetical protein
MSRRIPQKTIVPTEDRTPPHLMGEPVRASAAALTSWLSRPQRTEAQRRAATVQRQADLRRAMAERR